MAKTPGSVPVTIVPTIDQKALAADVRDALADVLEDIAEQLRTNDGDPA